MKILEFGPQTQIEEENLRQVEQLLSGEGIPLDDLEKYGTYLLAPGVDLRAYVGLLASLGKLQIATLHEDNTTEHLVVKYFEDRVLLKSLEEKKKRMALEAQEVLSQRGLIP